MHDLSVIIVSHNGRRWLTAALETLYAHAGDLALEVVVVDNGDDGAAAFVERRFDGVRTLRCENRGFAHANNRALETCDSRYVLFLNPDTEFLSGTLAGLIAAMDERPEVGLTGARQLDAQGRLAPTIRRFPGAARTLAEALGAERVPFLGGRLGERELRPDRYARETECDWTSGSFMLARREALLAAGSFDERFFLFSEETDLCLRIKQAGWEVRHLPFVTIRHFEGQGWGNPRLEAQNVYARLLYARKHMPRGRRGAYRAALVLRYTLRTAMYAITRRSPARRRTVASALRTGLGRGAPPFGLPSQTALAPTPLTQENHDARA